MEKVDIWAFREWRLSKKLPSRYPVFHPFRSAYSLLKGCQGTITEAGGRKSNGIPLLALHPKPLIHEKRSVRWVA